MLLGNGVNQDDRINYGIKINNMDIESVVEMKYPGVVTDCALKFQNHFDYISKRINKKLYFLCRIGQNLTQ